MLEQAARAVAQGSSVSGGAEHLQPSVAGGGSDQVLVAQVQQTGEATHQDAEAFRRLLRGYAAMPGKETTGPVVRGAAGRLQTTGSSGGQSPLRELFASIDGVAKEWKAAVEQVNSSSGASLSVRDVMRAHYTISKTSSMVALMGNVIGKSVQHLETLLRMQ